MAKSRDANHIAAQDVPDLVQQLNFLLQRMSDRLDKLEGIRDSFEAQSGGSFVGALTSEAMSISDDSGTEIHSFGEKD